MDEHKGNTGKVNKIKLKASIDRVIWTRGSACAGGKAGLAVDTHFTGNGSDMKIQLKDSSGKSHGTIDAKISGKNFWKEISIPENAKETLIAKVKLPKHNLEMDSNPLTVMPPVKITNLKWDKNELKREDVIKITADIKGMYDGAEAEVQIWEKDPDGANDLITTIPVVIKKEKIETSWEFKFKEKTEKIPRYNESEKGYNNPEYLFRIDIGGVCADSEVIKFKDQIKMSFVYSDGSIPKNADYVIHFADNSKKEGKLDENGMVELSDLPPGPCKIEINAPEKE